jgi:hypothetical protein
MGERLQTRALDARSMCTLLLMAGSLLLSGCAASESRTNVASAKPVPRDDRAAPAQVIYFGGPEGKPSKDSSSPEASLPPDRWSSNHRMEMFLQWVGVRWVNSQAELPTSQNDLAGFDVSSLMPEFKRYLQTSDYRQDLRRGLTIEEMWLRDQLVLRREATVVFNREMPNQPMSRVTRQVGASATEISERSRAALRSHCPVSAAVYDSNFGHVITLNAYDSNTDRVLFHDPWPGRSLLCEEQNAAGVKALKDDNKNNWSITTKEFEKVVVAIVVVTTCNGGAAGASVPR